MGQADCYLCGRDNFVRRKGCVRDNNELYIVECTDCGLVTLNSHDHITPEHYEQSGMFVGEPPNIDARLRNADINDQRRFEMLHPLIVNNRLLDFGCGAGGFLRKSSSLATKVVGIEPDLQFQNNIFDIYSDLKSSSVEGPYDLLTAFHVIEHLLDPRAILKELAELSSKQGRIVIEVPSSDDALLTLYDCDAFQKYTYWSQHLFLFNQDTLRVLAMQAGLRVVAIQQFQRYPLSNHLHWLSTDQAGGHQKWSFLDNVQLNAAYAASLAAIGKCDTLIAHLEHDFED